MELLKDGHSRTIEELAVLLDISTLDVSRQLEYMKNAGIIKSVSLQESAGCGSCKGCEGCSAARKGCMPPDVASNMGKMWEVTKRL